MKKKQVLTLLLIMVLVLALAIGCQPAEEPAPDPAPDQEEPIDEPADDEMGEATTYEDGPYRAELETDERGWTSFVEFTVEDGRIVEVNYDEYDEENNLKSEDEDYNQRWEAAAGISSGEAYPALEDQLIETQDIEAIDTVTGATASSDDFREVVLEALKGGADQ